MTDKPIHLTEPELREIVRDVVREELDRREKAALDKRSEEIRAMVMQRREEWARQELAERSRNWWRW